MRSRITVIVIMLALPALLAGGCRTAVQGAATLPRQNPASFTARQWADAYAVARELPLPQRIALWADLAALDAEYVADPLGEGPGAMPDDGPLSDFAHVDCVTYVEQVYALALAPDHQQLPDTLQRIRYRDGRVDYRWRNHYTVADWLPANAWFLRDVTDVVGAGHTAAMEKTISRAQFFAGKGLPQYADLADELLHTNYIPRDRVAGVTGRLQTGDLIIFMIATPGIDAGHVGLIRVKPDGVYLQHASLTAKRVVTVPLAEYLRTAPARFVGFKIARPSDPGQ